MNRYCTQRLISALAAIGIFAAHAGAQSSGGPYRLDPAVIAGGGGSLSGGAFQLHGTFGQSATATLSATTYRFYGGFWARAASSQMPDLIFTNGFDS